MDSKACLNLAVVPPTVAVIDIALDKDGMGRVGLSNTVSRRVPAIVTGALGAALLAEWANAPVWLPYGLALILAALAVVVLARRERRALASEADEGSWLDQELAGNGSPPGTYPLAFFGVVTIALTGFEGAYALPGWASLALIAAWAAANARYPSEESEA